MAHQPEKTKKKDDKQYKEMTHTFFDGFKDKEVTVSYRFSKPHSSVTERAQKEMQRAPGRGLKNLCLSTVHADDKGKLADDLKEYPGLSSTFGGALLKTCGFAELGN